MEDKVTQLLERINTDPRIFGGKPTVGGKRISVEMIVGQLAQGESFEQILKDYPDLEKEDILACLAFAHKVLAKLVPGED